MHFKVLGPLEVWADGVPVPLDRPKYRLLLAVLLANAGVPLLADHLVDIVWYGSPPPSARVNLRGYVRELRRIGAAISHGPSGYLLQVPAERIDSAEFVDLTERGAAALAAGTVEAGRTLLARALGLWRGDAYQEFDDVSTLAAQKDRLAAYRLTAIEQRIDADLFLGRAGELVPELTGLVDRHPYREHFCAQLMIALCRSGRPAEALDAYGRVRVRLADDLGIDPQPEIGRLHAAILRGDTELGLPAADRTRPGVAVRPVPAQLPADVPAFAGRVRELTRLTALTRELGEAGPVIVTITGVGGVGKTWLALRWAYQNRHRFADGQLYVDLRGFDPAGEPMAPATAVRGFLDALGVAPDAIPVGTEPQAALYRSLMATRRMLVLLDNARDTEQVAGLLPGTAPSAVLVTSRDRMTGLAIRYGASALPIDAIDDRAARDVLARRLGERRLTAETGAVARLVDACGGLPLALAIVAARASVARELRLAAIAEQLSDANTRLDALEEDGPRTSLRGVLSWSYDALPPVEARAFALLSVTAVADFGLPTAAALIGCSAAQADELVQALEWRSLVGRAGGGRWRMHDLVRLYAGERLEAHAAAEASRRLLDYLLPTAIAADRLLNPHRTPIALAVPVADPPPLPDEAAALAWLAAEHAALLAGQQRAADRGWHAEAWQSAWALSTFHRRTGRLHDEASAWRVALTAARQLGDAGMVADALRSLGEVSALTGDYGAAAEYLDEALEEAVRADDLVGQARGHRALAYACEQHGDDRRALEHAEHALRLYRTLGQPAREADALNAVGWYAARVGDHARARTHLHAGVELTRREGLRDAEAATLDSLGFLAERTGAPGEAVGHFQRALALVDGRDHTVLQAEILEHLGDAQAALGDHRAARAAWEQALTRVRHRAAAAERLQRRLDEARRHTG